MDNRNHFLKRAVLFAAAVLLSAYLGACASAQGANDASPDSSNGGQSAGSIAQETSDVAQDASSSTLDGIDAYLSEESITRKTEAVLEGASYPCVKDFARMESPEEGDVRLYFIEGEDIPYVALSEYMPLLSEILAGCDFEGIEYEVAPSEVSEHVYTVVRPDNESTLIIDTNQDTLLFSNFNTFTQKRGVEALVTIADLPDPQEVDGDAMLAALDTASSDEEMAQFSTMFTSQDTEENSLIRTAANSFNRSGGFKEFDLAGYDIDLVEMEGECYVPLQTMSDLFLGNIYVSCIFNGEKLFALQYGSNEFEGVYEAEPEQMSNSFALFNFSELCFLLDNFYGLKPEHAIESFVNYFASDPGFFGALIGTDPQKFDRAIAQLTGLYFDDSHSCLIGNSWRAGIDDFAEADMPLGPSISNLFTVSDKFESARKEAFPDGVPMYQEVGDTAFVTFDTFVSEDDLKAYYDPARKVDPTTFVISGSEDSLDENGEEEAPVDTIDLVRYAHEQITREGSPIKNVVVDLSANGGGNSDAAIVVISWLLGTADVALQDTTTGAQTFMSCTVDLNLNNVYEEPEDSLASQDVRLYCLTSPCSFSCGNLVPAALKNSERVTLVGQTSGGGSCMVAPYTTASGTYFQISGSKQLAIAKNGSFYNIDSGIDPDAQLTRIESYYNRPALVEYLNNLM